MTDTTDALDDNSYNHVPLKIVGHMQVVGQPLTEHRLTIDREEAWLDKPRSAFEAAISAPPYERDIARWPDDPKGYGWPGSYKDINVARAWQMWQEAARQENEACAQECEQVGRKTAECPEMPQYCADAIRRRGAK